MDLTSSANDFCVVVGICDYLEKIDEIDLEGRQICGLSSSSTTLRDQTLSRLNAADKPSNFVLTAK